MRAKEPDVCFHALRAQMPGLLLCCLPGFVVCFKVLMVSFSFPCHLVCFCLPHLPFFLYPLTHPVHHPTCISHARVLVLWFHSTPVVSLHSPTILHTPCPLAC